MAGFEWYQSDYAIITAANETTEGTSALGTVADDGIPANAIAVGMDAEHPALRLDSPNIGESLSPLTKLEATVKFKVPVYGKGLSSSKVVLPRWASVLFGAFCDIDVNTTPGDGTIVLNPISPKLVDATGTTTFKSTTSVSLGVFLGLLPVNGAATPAQVSGKKRKLVFTAARPKSVKFNLSPHEICFIDFEYIGKVSSFADVTTDLSAYTADGLAVDFITPNQLTSTIASNATKLSKCEIGIDFGTQTRVTDDAVYGIDGTAFGDPTINVSFNPMMVAASVYDQFAAMLLSTGEAFSTASIYPAGRSAATGYGIEFSAPKVQYSGSPGRGEKQIRWDFQGRAKKASDAGAPLTITLS